MIDADLEELELLTQAELYTQAEKSLHEFMRQAWDIVETTEFEDNWHIGAMAYCLEAVVNHVLDLPGPKIKDLIINIPFGSTKTNTVTVCFPSWAWCLHPTLRFITISNNQDQMTESAIKSRDIINSGWYKAGWGHRTVLSPDQATKVNYKNTQTGFRMAFGMHSKATGRHGDVLLLDDPHDAKDAMWSRVKRTSDIEAYKGKWASRKNHPVRSATVLVMQRLDPEDLTAYMKESGRDWTVLCIPFHYSGEKNELSALLDPRVKPGELYWPSRYTEKWYEEVKIDLGSRGVAAQLEQDPIALAGGIIDLRWFQRYAAPLVNYDQLVQFWDTAQKGEELIHCPWVCITAGRVGNIYHIIDVYREWNSYPDGKRAVIDQIRRFHPSVVVIEDKSTGQSLLQELPPGERCSFLPFEPELDKIARLGIESPAVEAGRVALPVAAPWLAEFEKEIANAGPAASYMDQADAFSMMLRWFRDQATAIPADCNDNSEDWPEDEVEVWPQ